MSQFPRHNKSPNKGVFDPLGLLDEPAITPGRVRAGSRAFYIRHDADTNTSAADIPVPREFLGEIDDSDADDYYDEFGDPISGDDPAKRLPFTNSLLDISSRRTGAPVPEAEETEIRAKAFGLARQQERLYTLKQRYQANYLPEEPLVRTSGHSIHSRAPETPTDRLERLTYEDSVKHMAEVRHGDPEFENAVAEGTQLTVHQQALLRRRQLGKELSAPRRVYTPRSQRRSVRMHGGDGEGAAGSKKRNVTHDHRPSLASSARFRIKRSITQNFDNLVRSRRPVSKVRAALDSIKHRQEERETERKLHDAGIQRHRSRIYLSKLNSSAKKTDTDEKVISNMDPEMPSRTKDEARLLGADRLSHSADIVSLPGRRRTGLPPSALSGGREGESSQRAPAINIHPTPTPPSQRAASASNDRPSVGRSPRKEWTPVRPTKFKPGPDGKADLALPAMLEEQVQRISKVLDLRVKSKFNTLRDSGLLDSLVAEEERQKIREHMTQRRRLTGVESWARLRQNTTHHDPKLSLSARKYASCNNLSGQDMAMLKQIFDSTRSEGLSQAQFSDVFANFISLPKFILDVIFLKMDASGDGILTWEEFTDFVLLDEMVKLDTVPKAPLRRIFPTEPVLEFCHSDMIDFVLQIEDGTMYLTFGRDYHIRLWSTEDLSLIKEYRVSAFGASGCFYPMKTKDGLRAGFRGSWHSGVKQAIALSSGTYEAPLKTNRKGYRLFKPADPTTHGEKYDFAVDFIIDRDDHSLIEVDAGGLPYVPWITDVCWNQGTRELMITGADKYLRVFNLTQVDGEWVFKVKLTHQVATVPTSVSTGYSSLLDKSFYVVGDFHGTVTAYEAQTCDQLLSHTYHSDVITKAETIEGLGVLSCSVDGDLRLCDAALWNCYRTFSLHQGGVYTFANCPAQRFFASGGADGKVHLWNPFADIPVQTLDAHQAPIVDIIVHNPSNQMFTIAEDKCVKVWDTRSRILIQRFVESHTHYPMDTLTAALFDEEHGCLVTFGNCGRFWYLETGAPGPKHGVKKQARVRNPGLSIKFTRKNDDDDQRDRGPVPAHKSRVVALLSSLPLRALISVEYDGRAKVWDIRTGVALLDFPVDHGAPVTSACLDFLGRRLVTGAHNGTVKMWNFNNGAHLHDFEPCTHEVSALLYFDPSMEGGHELGAVDWAGVLTLWPAPELSKSLNMLARQGHRRDALCLQIGPNFIATGSADGRVVIWNPVNASVRGAGEIPKTKSRAMKKYPPGVEALVWLGKSELLLAGSMDGDIHVIDHNTGQARVPFIALAPTTITAMAANRACTRLLVGCLDGQGKMFDIKDLDSCRPEHYEIRPIAVMDMHYSEVSCVQSLEAPSLLGSASARGDVRLWSYSGELVAVLGSGSWPKKLPHEHGSAKELQDALQTRLHEELSKRKNMLTRKEMEDSDKAESKDIVQKMFKQPSSGSGPRARRRAGVLGRR